MSDTETVLRVFYDKAYAAGVAAERERCAKVCEEFYSVENVAQKCAEAQAEISAMRRWVNNNMTFYDVEPDGPDVCTSGPNIPTLAGVSKRIWYHATDNQTVSLFSEVIDLRQWEGE